MKTNITINAENGFPYLGNGINFTEELFGIKFDANLIQKTYKTTLKFDLKSHPDTPKITPKFTQNRSQIHLKWGLGPHGRPQGATRVTGSDQDPLF